MFPGPVEVHAPAARRERWALFVIGTCAAAPADAHDVWPLIHMLLWPPIFIGMACAVVSRLRGVGRMRGLTTSVLVYFGLLVLAAAAVAWMQRAEPGAEGMLATVARVVLFGASIGLVPLLLSYFAFDLVVVFFRGRRSK